MGSTRIVPQTGQDKNYITATHFDGVTLRHTAITNVYRATKDLYLTQRFARHSSPLTTTIYTHPTDEELYESIRRLKA